jgi:inner membrane protein
MLAAGIPDVDGLGVIASQEAFWKYHHIVGHNMLFGLTASAALAILSRRRAKSFVIYLLLFHVHLLMDYLGSGPGWDISYLWPFSDQAVQYLRPWAFYSWQNLSLGLFFLIWIIWIARIKNRTPFEFILPSIDQQLVEIVKRK